MTDSFATKTDAQLLAELSQEIDALRHLRAHDQQRLLAMARGLEEEGMSLPFVIAGVRSSAGLLAELDEADGELVMERPKVRRFVAENAVNRGGAVVFRGNDVKRHGA